VVLETIDAAGLGRHEAAFRFSWTMANREKFFGRAKNCVR